VLLPAVPEELFAPTARLDTVIVPAWLVTKVMVIAPPVPSPPGTVEGATYRESKVHAVGIGTATWPKVVHEPP